jgi:hypothetical protein
MDDTGGTDEIERRLAALAQRRVDAGGSPRPLRPGTDSRIRRRQRITVVSACVIALVALSVGVLAAQASRNGTEVTADGGPSCYPAGIPAAVADAARRTADGGESLPGQVPKARVVAVPAGGAPSATVPADIGGGYVVEITGRHFSPDHPPLGFVDTSHRPNVLVVMFDRDLQARDIGIADEPADLAAIGRVIAVSVDPGCGSSTTTTSSGATSTSISATTSTSATTPTSATTSTSETVRPSALPPLPLSSLPNGQCPAGYESGGTYVGGQLCLPYAYLLGGTAARPNNHTTCPGGSSPNVTHRECLDLSTAAWVAPVQTGSGALPPIAGDATPPPICPSGFVSLAPANPSFAMCVPPAYVPSADTVCPVGSHMTMGPALCESADNKELVAPVPKS